jgi:Uroporphyrinogen decarboxylase (URO-D)
MSDQRSPRSVVKAWLRGERPVRPLFAPLTFSLGARLENIPPASFVANPTKIVNALRQIRANLKLDGVTCYFDPLLEAEALGAEVEWRSGGPVIIPGQFAEIGDLRARFSTGEQILHRGRIPVALEVLKRLKILLKDDPALMVGITGPLKLSSQLAGTTSDAIPHTEMIDFAAECTAALAMHFVEAGADVVILHETFPESANPELWEQWSGLVEPVINVVRFYEAMPVLLLDKTVSVGQVFEILNRNWECVVCVTASMANELGLLGAATPSLALTLPDDFFSPTSDANDTSIARIREAVEQVKPVFVTTAADLRANADMKQVSSLVAQFRHVFSTAA